MSPHRRDDEAWFEPKRYGYGVGFPVRWQGWALFAGFAVAIGLVPWFALNYLEGAVQWLFQAAGITVLIVGVLVIAHDKTRGGWRWRWGDDA